MTLSCSGVAKSIFRAFTARPNGLYPMDKPAREVFLEDLTKAAQWLETFPVRPSFKGKRVVEVGCGYGALCVKAAEEGAIGVLGVELDMASARVAEDMVLRDFPWLKGRVEFTDYTAACSKGLDGRFDIVLSQNAFEHYTCPEKVLARISEMLRPGGRIFAGFGPLWNSPFGSHLGWVNPLPWAHLWAGSLLLEEHNRLRPHDEKAGWESLRLNRNSLKRFEGMFNGLECLDIVDISHNLSVKRRTPAAYYMTGALRPLPFLREYLTASLFIVARKKA